MTIRALLLLTVVGVILITLGLFGLYFDVCRRLRKVNASIEAQRQEIRKSARRIKVIEDRDRNRANHVYFCTDNEIDEMRPDYSDIKYGGEGI